MPRCGLAPSVINGASWAVPQAAPPLQLALRHALRTRLVHRQQQTVRACPRLWPRSWIGGTRHESSVRSEKAARRHRLLPRRSAPQSQHCVRSSRRWSHCTSRHRHRHGPQHRRQYWRYGSSSRCSNRRRKCSSSRHLHRLRLHHRRRLRRRHQQRIALRRQLATGRRALSSAGSESAQPRRHACGVPLRLGSCLRVAIRTISCERP